MKSSFTPSTKWVATTPTIQVKVDDGMVHQAYWNGARDGYVGGTLMAMVLIWVTAMWRRS